MKLFYPGRSLLACLTAVFLIISNLTHSQSSSTFSFDAIPYSDPDFIAPGRGAEQWHNGTARISYPSESSNLESFDVYYRFPWNKIEGATQGSYTWTYFDNLVKDAINKGQKLSFGIMTYRSDNGDGIITYAGGRSAYPQYLHDLMQSESVKDYMVGGVWVPNWNSSNYVARLRALHQAIAERLKTVTYRPTSGPNAGKTVLFKDAIYCIDIRGFGNWGEWHTGDIGSWNTLTVKPTAQSLINIINAHTETFDEWPLSMMVAAFDGGMGSTDLFAPYPEVAYHALTARNKWGAIGYRRDQWGATDGYLNRLMAGNNQTYNGSQPFKTLILEKYKYAPVTGEPMPSSLDMSDLENQVNLYHATSVGNGNYGAQPTSSTVKENIRKAFKRAGYRIELTGGSATASSSSFTVNLNWRNVGVAPTYEDWKVTYELRNGSTVVWSGTSSFKPKLFLPSPNATTATDVFDRTGLPQGTYSLYVIVKENSGYRQPLPLAIKGRGSDGSYLLTNSINIPAASGNNQPPVANAGTSQTITLPTSSANLTGSASSDADGSISSYLWQQVSGPSTSTLSATNTANITVSNLQAGVYTYRLTVTDNSNATATATVTVTVNAAANQAPVANAGPDRTITLPVSSATLNGSGTDADGSIARYGWQQVSGPSTSTLSATNTASITVSNLEAGVYTYRLTVSDNGGATATATVTVTVNAAANQAPVANAGPDRTITLPVSSATLNGSGTDADGSIARYGWQQVSGPSTSTLSATNTASITVSNLEAGVYTYRLTVTDNDGATATATVTVTVNAAANQAPVADAGPDRTITLPVSSATLNGSGTDADGSIARYGWQQVSGPSTSTLSATNTASITVSNLEAGVYTYRLTVSDNGGATATATVTVTVNAAANQAPVANAGPDRTITLPVSSATLNGSGTDADGSIARYGWQQVSGPSTSTLSATNTASITVSNLEAGVYTYRLTVTDNDGATATATVTVTVNAAANQAPVADAGPDRTITLPVSSATLNGSGTDADGSIARYGWQQVSGPSTSTLSATNTASITVSNLEAGVYTYRLTVSDNDGATATATVTVTVNAAANQAPVANAGSNRTVTLPTSSTNLDGSSSSDADGTISNYRWEQVSGPSDATFSATNTSGVTVSDLQAGVYRFRLTVTDNDKATDNDEVTVTVNSAPANQVPVASAGNNRSVTLPTSTVNLDGSGSSDADGTIVTYLWEQLSGPAASTLSATNTASITVSNLEAGVYSYRLTVTDNDNASAIDVVTVTVNPAVNRAPVSNAGSNRAVTLPTSSTTLDGSASSDADGTITSYLWQQVSGPATSTLSATNTASITVSDLQAGVYTYRLTVTDNNNATGTDLVSVTVNSAAVNQPPTANAGTNRTITLPTNSASLNGTASADADGTIASYEWEQVSGPAATTFSATNTANITVSNLQAGVYTYRLTVTDNDNATDSDLVTVTVNAAPNQAPSANAGPNRVITLPTNSTTLDGSASSDADGTIATYRWQQVSGPSTSTLSATNTANITVSNLQAGVYSYRLTVTDNNNTSRTDVVTVTVNPAANQAPVANAGANKTITLPTNTTSLSGTASSDPDGTIASYQWRQVSGPSTATLSATNTVGINVSNLEVGVYTFRLTVRDNDNATDTDDVTVTVNAAPNQAPIANAGADKTITLPTNTTSLSGTASSDPDGTIASYQWRQVSGPSTATLSATNTVGINVSNLEVGVYTFRLTVRDNDNATDTDDVTVTVNAAPNQAPVANAGADKTITLPTSTTSLSGAGSSDPDGTIASYQWQQVSGPSTATLSATNTVGINLSNLRAGVYTFRLTVRDNNNATATDEVRVTVNAAPNQAPIANAGANKTITLPTNTTSLSGAGSSDPDGSIVSYQWAQVSGPSTATLSGTNTAGINLSNLKAGVYTFRLTVRDNDNATASATVTVTVNAATNRAPVANAGADRVITLPTNSTNLSGAASSDPDGTITSYQWQQVSGPSASTLSSTSGVNITVSNLRAGVYSYRLTVRDNNNATATATVQVTVNNAANKAPVARAGADQVIVVTANSTTLDASTSTDPDGNIVSYAWQQISGPSASTMSAVTGVSINVSNLQIGEYVYRVTVRDNRNATATATVKVTVIDNFRSFDKPAALYPNPATDIVNIRLLNDKAERVEISVYDMSGKMVLPMAIVSKPAGAYTTSIDVTRLKQGNYIVQIASFGKKKTTAKFLKL